MGLTRRDFVRTSVLAAGVLPIWFAAPGSAAARKGDPLLVVIFQRGGADGLHVVPPIGDPDYARSRGSLALSDALPFDRHFGLHPALADLLPLVDRRELAVVHAAGSPDPSRSHFAAQDSIEAGRPGSQRIVDGWLARALRTAEPASAFSALALTDALPVTLRGSGAFAISDPRRFGIPGASERALAVLGSIYEETRGDVFGTSGQRAFAALADYQKRTGLGAPRGFGRPARPQLESRVRALIDLERTGLPIRAVLLESFGWDTHLRQGTDRGTMTGPLTDLGRGLAALYEGLAERRDLLIVVMTEFGRTVRPNGSGGTDHGHGSAMLVAGPRVRGGAHGSWPGLETERLWEGRDLPVANDYRHVLSEVLQAHLGQAAPEATFPDFAPRHLGLIAS